jgi:hypothetical protein
MELPAWDRYGRRENSVWVKSLLYFLQSDEVTTTNRQRKTMQPGRTNRLSRVLGGLADGKYGRLMTDGTVPEQSGAGICIITPYNDLASDRRAQLARRGCQSLVTYVHHSHCHSLVSICQLQFRPVIQLIALGLLARWPVLPRLWIVAPDTDHV